MTIWILREDFLIELVSASPQETLTLGRRISGSLVPGSVVALRGGLGSGKTCLVKGIADGLGIRETVTSPTYTIISEYPGSPTLYHIDAYRLESEQDFERIGGGEVISGSGISVIEWSERIQKSLPECAVVIELKITGSFSRLIRISGLEFA